MSAEGNGAAMGIASTSKGTIAFFGLGRMGMPMAARLAQAGWTVIGLDPSELARRGAAEQGIEASDDPGVVRTADVIATMLPDDRAVGELIDASAGVVTNVPAGALWLEMTSSHPKVTRQLAQLMDARECAVVDVPVSGGVRGAQEGTLTILAGGSVEALERAKPLLEVISSRVIRVGDRPGDGDMAKSLNNMLSAVNLTAASEAMALAAKSGLDLQAFAQAVAGSSGGSHAMAVKVGQFALGGDFDAGFTIDQYRKDLRIALSAFADADLDSRLGRAAQEIWSRLSSAGHGAEDHTRVVALLGGLGADSYAGASASRGGSDE
jgi:3-hydroxyisobutyrate dehydrogenase-like beta-hydroxyacid dehydrogenase